GTQRPPHQKARFARRVGAAALGAKGAKQPPQSGGAGPAGPAAAPGAGRGRRPLGPAVAFPAGGAFLIVQHRKPIGAEQLPQHPLLYLVGGPLAQLDADTAALKKVFRGLELAPQRLHHIAQGRVAVDLDRNAAPIPSKDDGFPALHGRPPPDRTLADLCTSFGAAWTLPAGVGKTIRVTGTRRRPA